MKIHEPQNYSTEYITTKNLLSSWSEIRKKNKKYTCHCIFVFSFTQRAITNKQQLHTTRRPLRRRIITCMQKQKFKKKAGELITHHPFVDDVGRTILSHHHQWCSSSCFPTWEVQILEHSPTQRKASLACGPRFRYEQTATTKHSALSSDLLWHNNIENGLLMHDDPGTVHVVRRLHHQSINNPERKGSSIIIKICSQ